MTKNAQFGEQEARGVISLHFYMELNRSFPSCRLPLCQNESSWKTIHENVFHLQVHFQVNQTHFQKKSFVRRLVLKQRHNVTRKWPIHSALLENQHQHLTSKLFDQENISSPILFTQEKSVQEQTNLGVKKKSSCCYSPTITVFKGQINNTIRPKTVRSIRLIELVLERILLVLQSWMHDLTPLPPHPPPLLNDEQKQGLGMGTFKKGENQEQKKKYPELTDLLDSACME